jgi:hypothetical protein
MAEKKTPAPFQSARPVKEHGSSADVTEFLSKVREIGKTASFGGGRIVLALDATMSRQPTWDLACKLQGDMFDAVGKAGSLSVQLVYFRGLGECRASSFVHDTGSLKNLMSKIDCRGGHTQIGKVLSHCLKETGKQKISAVIYIGDALEEPIDDLCDKAGRLGLLGVPLFLFQEGHDGVTEKGYREMARLSRGAWFRFDQNSAATLGRLLSSIAIYATGGLKALESRGNREDRLLIEQLKPGSKK